jgi:hypothetical protein
LWADKARPWRIDVDVMNWPVCPAVRGDRDKLAKLFWKGLAREPTSRKHFDRLVVTFL